MKVTKEIVIRVKGLRRSNPNLKNSEIALLCEIGGSTVGKILHGDYDHLLEGAIANHDEIATQLNELVLAIDRLTHILAAATEQAKEQKEGM